MKVSLMRDPLVHFALIGALLFFLSLLFPKNTQEDTQTILVSQNRIDHLAAVFSRSWQRAPTVHELQGLVENHIREEVLYRAALDLGLDRDDTVIRRRLRLKMEFLARDLVNTVDPQDGTLQQYFADNANRYRLPARFSFRQIYFNTDERLAAGEDAREALAQLRAGETADNLGDSNLLPNRYREESAARVDQVFGGGFATRLSELPRGQWAGPVTSAYGEHLIYVDRYQPSRPPDFAAVRQAVLRDWQVQEKEKVLQQQYEDLRANYQVRIEGKFDVNTGGVALQ